MGSATAGAVGAAGQKEGVRKEGAERPPKKRKTVKAAGAAAPLARAALAGKGNEVREGGDAAADHAVGVPARGSAAVGGAKAAARGSGGGSTHLSKRAVVRRSAGV